MMRGRAGAQADMLAGRRRRPAQVDRLGGGDQLAGRQQAERFDD